MFHNWGRIEKAADHTEYSRSRGYEVAETNATKRVRVGEVQGPG
jgi:hypothetical protein